MSVHSTQNNQYLLRDQIYSRDITELLMDDLFAMRFVRTLSDFPDGTTYNLPSIGEAQVQTYVEGGAIKYNALDTGNFTFDIDQYIYSANAITNKYKRDSYWSSDLISYFAPRQHRAIMQQYEARVWNRANAGQTSADLNNINDAPHRWVAQGANNTLIYNDFSKARFSLFKANVPLRNLVAIVDPSVAYVLETQANVTNLMTPMGNWADTLKNGLTSGLTYRFNFLGFDVFQSNYLPRPATETIDGTASGSTAVANFFFSAEPGDTLPLVGAWRQMPTVESEYKKDLQQTEYLTICEYGVKLYRPDNLVTVLSNYDVV
jgi:hypothetical protein